MNDTSTTGRDQHRTALEKAAFAITVIGTLLSAWILIAGLIAGSTTAPLAASLIVLGAAAANIVARMDRP